MDTEILETAHRSVYRHSAASCLYVHEPDRCPSSLQATWTSTTVSFQAIAGNRALLEPVKDLAGFDLVLIDWEPLFASVIPRFKATEGCPPIVVLSPGSVDVRIAALAMEADYVEAWPPHPAFLQVVLNRTRARGAPENEAFVAPYVQESTATYMPEVPADSEAKLSLDRLASDSLGSAPFATDRLIVDDLARVIRVDGTPLALTPTAYRLLAALVPRPGVCFERQELLDMVWGEAYMPTSNVIEYTVSKLRQALSPHGLQHRIVTVRGAGYRYEAE